MLPMGGDTDEVLSEKEKKKTVSAVGAEVKFAP